MSRHDFTFKQFTVAQSRSAMKVGTDGVILGAWFDVGEGPVKILDAGCGTGLIALMAAQRNPSAIIDAIDIEDGSVEDATENACNSSWGGRITVYNISLQDYAALCEIRYDRIVSNPPYFINSLESPDDSRTMARHTGTLSFEELISSAVRLMKEDALFAVILPLPESEEFERIALDHGLHPSRVLEIRPTAESPVKRRAMEFAFVRREHTPESLTIEYGGRHIYSRGYIELTREFYLKF